MMRAAPTEEMRIFLCTQIADEARHVRFFNRFYDEVGVLEADNLQDRLGGDERAPEPEVQRAVRRDAQEPRRPARARPEDLETLVEAVTLYHMVIEGMLALTGQHFIIEYNEELGTLPGLRRGLQQDRPRRAPARGLRRALPARHGAGRTPATARRSSARWWRSAPAADGVLQPPWYVEGETELFGATHGGDARLRDEGARAAAEGDRPGADA